MENFDGIKFTTLDETHDNSHIIKVIGVGGGGGNAVENMYRKGVQDVDFALCNTDRQALNKSSVPVKLQIGNGLGVGGDPVKGKQAAVDSISEIENLFEDNTQMVFITAGMGGGTGTGAAPVIAEAAKKRGLLTVGVVTIPFKFERAVRIRKALCGVEELKREVDSLLVINNERLMEIYGGTDTTFVEAFQKADEVLTTATKCISEIITKRGRVNRDFNDVKTVMKGGGSAIMSVGYGTGENRIMKAINEALESPLINKVDIARAHKLLYIIYSGSKNPVRIAESAEINEFMENLSPDLEVLWGLYDDDTLEDEVKVTIVATGFDKPIESNNALIIDADKEASIEKLKDFYYGENPEPKKEENTPEKTEVPAPTPQEEETNHTTEAEVAHETTANSESEPESEVTDIEATDPDAADDKHGCSANWLFKLKEFIKISLSDTDD